METQFFDGIVELNIDAYQEIRRNIISSRLTVPASMGLEVAPLDNVGSTRSRGSDFLGKVQHMFNNESYIILNGTLTYNKTVYRDIEEATNVPDWQRKKGKEITFNLGFSHPVVMADPEGIETVMEGQNVIIVKGIDKEKVGQYAAEIRELRKPEPYKGKGIKYADEVIRRKVGKTGAK